MPIRLPFLKSRRNKYREIAPDEILMDSSNLPDYDTSQFEGRLEKPISTIALYSMGGFFVVVVTIFLIQAFQLQIVKGAEYAERSEKNIVRPIPIFAGRGVITDRNGVLLAWNAPQTPDLNSSGFEETPATTSNPFRNKNEEAVSRRMYATTTGLAHVLGYVQYPTKDKNGFYYRNDFEGVDGAEKFFNEDLQGTNGSRLVEVDARGNIISENIIRPPVQGAGTTLSIDSKIQSALYNNIEDAANKFGFIGGAGVIMDVHTGELLALTSYPEYSPQVMSDKTDSQRISSMLNNPRLFFLDRAVNGLYTPGSIVKPFISLGVLNEKIIDPTTIVYTTGSVTIQNPYDPTKSTVFKDWKNNGALDMRKAISMSSDAYFYIVGGGYKDQKGLGITNIDKYLQMFGFGQSLPDTSFASGKSGTIPTPDWKKKTFNEDWYLGDTYHTAIGQYGFQVTPVQIVRAVAAMANNGTVLTPTIVNDKPLPIDHTVELPKKYFDIVHEGMRLGVLEGTLKGLNVPYVTIAGKSGTAELGSAKEKVNSWITGFWPYENPKYAFTIILERGPISNQSGAIVGLRQLLDWMSVNESEYFK